MLYDLEDLENDTQVISGFSFFFFFFFWSLMASVSIHFNCIEECRVNILQNISFHVPLKKERLIGLEVHLDE